MLDWRNKVTLHVIHADVLDVVCVSAWKDVLDPNQFPSLFFFVSNWRLTVRCQNRKKGRWTTKNARSINQFTETLLIPFKHITKVSSSLLPLLFLWVKLLLDQISPTNNNGTQPNHGAMMYHGMPSWDFTSNQQRNWSLNREVHAHIDMPSFRNCPPFPLTQTKRTGARRKICPLMVIGLGSDVWQVRQCPFEFRRSRWGPSMAKILHSFTNNQILMRKAHHHQPIERRNAKTLFFVPVRLTESFFLKSKSLSLSFSFRLEKSVTWLINWLSACARLIDWLIVWTLLACLPTTNISLYLGISLKQPPATHTKQGNESNIKISQTTITTRTTIVYQSFLLWNIQISNTQQFLNERAE